MLMVAQCPNPSCRRSSHPGEDPLGRIFRCPRCLTKLPATGTNTTDSSWTAVLGPLPRRFSPPTTSSTRVQTSSATSEYQFCHPSDPATLAPANGTRPGALLSSDESGSFFAAAFLSAADDSWDTPYHSGHALHASGEFYVGRFYRHKWLAKVSFPHCSKITTKTSRL